MTEGSATKRTPLFETHRDLDARMTAFAGWEMPLWYSSIIQEHKAVRERAGLFDVSHMGEISVEGQGALETVQRLITNDAEGLAPGQAQYAAMCNGKGGIIDDLTVYRLGPNRFWLVVNAANTAKDYRWVMRHRAKKTVAQNISDQVGLLALQGPESLRILSKITTCDLAALKNYNFGLVEICNLPVIISRTGYTGEDGFEIYCDGYSADEIWTRIMEAGKSYGLLPCGLACRDTLRLEAGMRLHGQDIDEQHTPIEAGLSWVVKFAKPSYFVGKRALLARQKQGLNKKLVGFEMQDRIVARPHYPIFKVAGERIGEVSSGGPSITLGKNIGMGYVPPEYAEPGRLIYIYRNGSLFAAKTVPLPFYKRPK
ncbi:MAG: hypothetical protein A2667_03440 [Candidatus Wildermuthbacteria bacterium RIFCSPHIGHO2_01_FULL_47_27]|uniref:Aminomethyltransferase n=2 Tax=Candidatus Wildermuthiibacteriota TaxID=1817923 RepID=A0A1G2RPA1_9BACT|nr:MAG: Aminomethyltransferase [Parcubacteria group bacterium GW2011_GWA2_47_9]OHA63521.1 MAG: hypothetical protein A2667_03440 [Candidatus Wildermuthbacteria bacterium RIFCSPHIGHO2_01_FULL_47_27]OHA67513.1 MAG: hypothetical protein A3D59_03795 [Candidatus Wildermuthbacteria bacterium RIFCSPHIGHO2_02_FULL_47_17]OHA74082.1 MAG: hypothetical protein A3A32_02205 [Candidatus Wildermuthbacteria bacterium RIFCSPLOWO2_01_FULL_48_35]